MTITGPEGVGEGVRVGGADYVGGASILIVISGLKDAVFRPRTVPALIAVHTSDACLYFSPTAL